MSPIKFNKDSIIADDVETIIFEVPRAAVEQMDIDYINEGLQKLIENDRAIRICKSKVTVSFSGYGDDPREVYQIDEIKDYLQTLTLKFPYWFYFSNKKDHTLAMILLAHCRFKNFIPGVPIVLSEDSNKTYNIFQDSLKEFYSKYNLSELDYILLSEEVLKYFNGRINLPD